MNPQRINSQRGVSHPGWLCLHEGGDTSERNRTALRTSCWLSLPSRALPCHALPCQAKLSPALHPTFRWGRHCRGIEPQRDHQISAAPIGAPAAPRRALPRRAEPSPASPRPAQPRRALSPTEVRQATAGDRTQLNPPGDRCSCRSPCRATPCQAPPRHAVPCQAAPSRALPSRALLGLTPAGAGSRESARQNLNQRP